MLGSARPVRHLFALAVVAAALVACGGGGAAPSAGSAVPTAAPLLPTVTASPAHPSPAPASPSAAPTASSASPTPWTLAISGTVTELVSGAALAGFAVTVGQLPNGATCLAGQTETMQPCGVPVAPLTVATTDASGAFSMPVPTSGTYMLTIGKDGTFATLHRTVTVGTSSASLGAVHVAALSSDEQAWLTDVNNQRVTVSFPASYGNLVVDEYAEEEARAEVAAIASGTAPYGDATEEIYGEDYLASPGAMYGIRGVADLVSAERAYLAADASWMIDEKTNCPNGNWQNCATAPNTGHYINVSDSDDVWIGLAESSQSFSQLPQGIEWAYAMLMPANV